MSHPIKYIFEQEASSTNSVLKELVASQQVNEGTVVWCDNQYAGRGQRGNTWESENGKNLTFSQILYPSWLPVTQQFRISQLVSLAVIDVLSPLSDGFSIKWPNDIYWNGKKIGGMLVENSLSSCTFTSSVVGIGININQEIFLSNAPNPISLCHITGLLHDREELLHAITEKIIERCALLKENFEAESLLLHTQYMDSLFRKEGYHLYEASGERFMARMGGVEATGFLHLITSDGENRKFAFKEISFLLG